MKKMIFFITVLFICILFFAMPVSATETNYQARINNDYYETFEDAINAAKTVTTDSTENPTTITVLENFTLTYPVSITLNDGDYILVQSENVDNIKTILLKYVTSYFTMNSGSVLILKNITLDGGAIWRVNQGTNEEPIWQDVSGPNVTNAVNKGALKYQSLLSVSPGGSLKILDHASIINSENENGNPISACIANNGDLTIDGGTIANNDNALSTIWNGGTLTINSGLFYGNRGSNSGIIYNDAGTMGVDRIPYYGTVNLNGGEYYGNSGYNYGAVYNNATLNITGGTITGNTTERYLFSSGIYNLSIINLSGNPVITGNYPLASYDDNQHIFIKSSGLDEGNLCLYGKVSIINIVGALTKDAKIGINNAGFLNKVNIATGVNYKITDADMKQLSMDKAMLQGTCGNIFLMFLKNNNVNLAPITDVAINDWYYNFVDDLVSQGILTGYANVDGSFSFNPNNPITRAEFATILAKASGEDLSGYANKTSFNDVAATYWGAKYIEWAFQNHVVSGVGSGKYDPEANITRQEMAVMIYRFATEYQKGNLPQKNAALTFTDNGSIASWSATAVLAMQQAGVINGIANGNGSYRFEPNGNAQRSAAATMISIYLGL